MTKRKKPSAWRAVFLRALGVSGNVRAAAIEAGVDYTTAYNHRKRDVGFAGEWASALEARLVVRPLDFAPDERGRELIVRSSKRCGPQLVKTGAGPWSRKAERVFLSHLRATGCFRRAAAATGFSTNAITNRRNAYPAFAALCDAAVEEAKVTLHSLVVGAGIAGLDPLTEDEEPPKVSMAEAIAILRLKGTGSFGTGPRGRHMPEEPSIEEVRENILRKLDAIEAAERRQGEGSSPGGEDMEA